MDQHQWKNFRRFLNAFIEVELGNPTNTSCFRLRSIRCGIYSEFDSVPIESIDKTKVDNIRGETKLVSPPDHASKVTEFKVELAKCTDLLAGLEDGSLKTIVKTTIPFILHLSQLSITVNWRGINVAIDITPRFGQIVGMISTTAGSAMQQVGPSRWQDAISDICITFDALVDCDAFAEPLQSFHAHSLPVNGWPKCFTMTFEILRQVAWRVRLEHGGETQWVLAPRDIGDVEWTIGTAATDQIVWKKKGSPATMMRVFSPSSATKTIDLGPLTEPRWSAQCLSVAIMYFEMGQREECLFWLNVGVESLFEERFEEFAKELDQPGLLDDLIGPNARWAPAKEIVAGQFPDIADKIEWPDDKAHVSMYSKLTYLHRAVDMNTNIKELKSTYSKLHKHRNKLFHGHQSADITVKAVTAAIESFEWIHENFVLSKGTNE